ncbi:hypothetical protein M3223_09325 [Paenibacillus pasadenensis]|uniref:hypothetical protein n=1 Tax=Paenibacillus pasadenensis TaxID=217090 RepID=UPI00203DED39|nr:hypothetical protein [Paenibacillus pasadenensis]MCM3747556.1 hypothetical protein [Paenibacillus pasadenensis]
MYEILIGVIACYGAAAATVHLLKTSAVRRSRNGEHYIIMTRDDESQLEHCIRSLQAYSRRSGLPMRITIWDLGSTDDTAGIASRCGDEVVWLKLPGVAPADLTAEKNEAGAPVWSRVKKEPTADTTSDAGTGQKLGQGDVERAEAADAAAEKPDCGWESCSGSGTAGAEVRAEKAASGKREGDIRGNLMGSEEDIIQAAAADNVKIVVPEPDSEQTRAERMEAEERIESRQAWSGEDEGAGGDGAKEDRTVEDRLVEDRTEEDGTEEDGTVEDRAEEVRLEEHRTGAASSGKEAVLTEGRGADGFGERMKASDRTKHVNRPTEGARDEKEQSFRTSTEPKLRQRGFFAWGRRTFSAEGNSAAAKGKEQILWSLRSHGVIAEGDQPVIIDLKNTDDWSKLP